MPHLFRLILVAGFTAALSTGCSQPESRHQQLSRSAAQLPPLDRQADHLEWVKRLMSSPPTPAIQQVSVSGTAPAALPIPVPPAVSAKGIRYTLIVDQAAQLVWLDTAGGDAGMSGQRHGPWKITHPDVAHLLHSLTTTGGPTSPETGSRLTTASSQTAGKQNKFSLR